VILHVIQGTMQSDMKWQIVAYKQKYNCKYYKCRNWI